ncbi:Glycosyltransferase involved in cell wall bisynthesis [Blastococcus aurantiacus]|uniref:Glycosyltransferase involved in cell wall bisynthesis n=1 Tax=Blastococcus aurantiacus TaxID=1550231 RepID=A0A1G7JJT2_9ACTN|nr:glycosyltransferase [Blastococcus aurantiacus]SDF25180.1 Glycosyltransferase involved in cell wall bisynthesis [Blastococcus aurantiacus]
MTGPLVSILIPTYNGERYLKAALRSARDQSYRNVEIVIGDDGSIDSTPSIIAAAAAEDDRIRVIRHETNVGAYENLRSVLEAAGGEYVKYLLHDDVLATDCVRELVRGLESTPDAALAFSRRSLIDENGRSLGEFPAVRDRPGAIDGRELGDTMLETCTNVIGEFTTALIRRDALDPSTIWDPDGRRVDVITDVKVWLELLARGPAWFTPRTLSRFRQHPGQNTWNPWIMARGERDWVRLIDWGIGLGFLAEPAQRRTAYARLLDHATRRLGTLLDDPNRGPSLEAVFLATAALVELEAGGPDHAGGPLWARAHGPALLGRFAQQLEVWARTYPVALAAPALDAAEIGATVQALRDVAAAGVAGKLVIAVPPAALEEAVPLVERALAEGTDIDVELVPADDPAALLAHPWLAVAPRAARWHEDRAAAVWSVDAGHVIAG